jgi:hypothetical protein
LPGLPRRIIAQAACGLPSAVLRSQCQGTSPCPEGIHRLPRSCSSLLAYPSKPPLNRTTTLCLLLHTLLLSAPNNSMDNSYFGDRGFHDFQNYRPDGLNGNHLNIFGQQSDSQQRYNERHQHQHQPVSPGQPRSRGSSFTGSPTSPPAAHRPAVSQPSSTQLQPGYYPIGATGAMQQTLSPVTPTYDLSRSHSMNSILDYGYEGSLMSLRDESGSMRLRNNSE